MKQFYLILMVVCLPLFANAGLLNKIQHTGKHLPQTLSRDFRLSHEITSYKESGVWAPSSKNIVFYSNSHPAQADSIHSHLWDGSGWGVPMSFGYYQYNAAGMVTSAVMSMMMITDTGVQKIPFFRTEAFYDAQNRIIHYNMFTKNFYEEDYVTWIPEQRIHIAYLANDQFKMSSWEQDYLEEHMFYNSTFSFDDSGRITEELSYVSADSTDFVLDSKTETVYHPADNSTGADYISYISSFLGSSLSLMFWDMPILITSNTQYSREFGEWNPENRNVWEFDASLRRIRQDEDSYNGDDWTTDNRTLFTYNTNGTLETSIEQSGFTGAWTDETKTEFFWDGITGSEDLVQNVNPALQIKAWPMPFAESLNISTTAKSGTTSRISIYNSRGQLLREFTGLDNLVWDGKDSQGRDSANGIYFIRANQDNTSAVRKVIRVK